MTRGCALLGFPAGCLLRVVFHEVGWTLLAQTAQLHHEVSDLAQSASTQPSPAEIGSLFGDQIDVREEKDPLMRMTRFLVIFRNR